MKRGILHYVSNIGAVMGSNSASIILILLFNEKEIDFSLADIQGDTPLHKAAKCSELKTNHAYIFPNFVEAATERNFDFSTLNNEGK